MTTVAAASSGAVSLLSLALLTSRIPAWHGPADWIDVAAGWLATCALLSCGEVLAAGAVAAGGEVTGARFHWRTRFPHFRTDTAEAMAGGRATEVAVAALRSAPMLAGAAAAAWYAPGLLAALCGGALYVLAPFGPSAARQWLAARRRAPRYSIHADFHFEPVRTDLWARGRARLQAFTAEFGWLGLAWTVVWAAWSFLAFTRCMPNTAAALRAWTRGAPAPVQLGAEYLLIAALGLGVAVSIWAGVRHWLIQRAWRRPLRGADARERNRPPLTGEPADLLAQVPLFQGLAAEHRAALAAALAPVELRRHDEVTREDEPGDDFFLVVSGELEVKKRLHGRRRPETIGWLGPGDGFGEIALLENTTRTATVVASRSTRLLRLGRAEFQELVVGPLGVGSVRELLQSARFLGRLTFTAGWSFADLLQLARRCHPRQFEASTSPIVRGQPNAWFYLIYDGAFAVRDGAKVLRRLGPGDYFGEISLLDGTEATATVTALEESRCLALNRHDFLALFARDFRLGLRMEAQAEQRLGTKVFVTR
jgi:CRP-like cAMP-binding protein